MSRSKKRSNICIVGFGRFGKLLAGLLAPFGEVFVIDEKKIAKCKHTQIKISDLGKMDWVIFCVPISSLESVLTKSAPHLKKGSLVMDVCSVKVWPCRWLEKYCPDDVEILGSHPMFGPDSALHRMVQGTTLNRMVQGSAQGRKKHLMIDGKFLCLEGLQIVFCPLRISQKKLEETEKVFRRLGLEIVEADPKEHDKQTAKSLALVHYLGRALGKMKIKKQKISTLGFERLLAVNETVNNDTWQLFKDMQEYNPYGAGVRKKFQESCQEIEKMIKKRK